MASLSTCHLGLWLGWQILLNLVKLQLKSVMQNEETQNCWGVGLHCVDIVITLEPKNKPLGWLSKGEHDTDKVVIQFHV